MKTCTGCRQEKPLAEFGKQRRNRDGLMYRCKACMSAGQRAYYSENREKYLAAATARRSPEKERAKRLRYKYGLTPDEYERRLAAQDGKCAICQTPQAEAETQHGVLVVDHDHACCPGKTSCGNCVRGLLCDPCNRAIGFLKDSPDRAMGAAAYLLLGQDLLSPASSEEGAFK
ncbi:endonuclease VII domain-containing protein [Nonomuraea wenchangensis]